jgi:hypothetical protein
MVVDSPPGMMTPSAASMSERLLAQTTSPERPRFFMAREVAAMCSVTAPWRPRTAMFMKTLP